MNELIVEAKDDNLSKVLDFVDKQLESNDCPMKIQFKIDVAVEEIFVNIAHYAYEDSGTVKIIFDIQSDLHAAKITFIDTGRPYDPLEKADPDITLSAEERRIGGLGIYMVKKSMDKCLYEYKNGENHFTIIKAI